jgi:hypothetical protein
MISGSINRHDEPRRQTGIIDVDMCGGRSAGVAQRRGGG